MRDHLDTARRWGEAALADDPAARYLFLMWNCLWRAGGSIVHGHMQMTATRGTHYPQDRGASTPGARLRRRLRPGLLRRSLAGPRRAGPRASRSTARALWLRSPRSRSARCVILGRPGLSEAMPRRSALACHRGVQISRRHRLQHGAVPAAARARRRRLARFPTDRAARRSGRSREQDIRHRCDGAVRRERRSQPILPFDRRASHIV